MSNVLIDTHAHLDYPDYEEDLPEVIERAKKAGVNRLVTIATGLESCRRAIALSERFDEVYAVVGIHPTNVMDEPDDFVMTLRDLASAPKVVAIGETGLDYHHLPSERLRVGPERVAESLQADVPDDAEAAIADGAYKTRQAAFFEAQLDLAVELGLNVVIHQRDAWDDTLSVLSPYQGKLKGVFHCFGGTLEQATEVLALGHLVSFTGIVTFKNAREVRDTVRVLPDESFMVETDCPYLAPTPFRGKRCEPAHTRLVAEQIAEVRGVALEVVVAQTSKVAEGFFRFGED